MKSLKGTSRMPTLPLEITSKCKREFFNSIQFNREYFFRGDEFNFVQEKKIIGETKDLQVKFLVDEQKIQRKFNFNFLVSIKGKDKTEIMNLRRFLKDLK
jgi:hypothetical protein